MTNGYLKHPRQGNDHDAQLATVSAEGAFSTVVCRQAAAEQEAAAAEAARIAAEQAAAQDAAN